MSDGVRRPTRYRWLAAFLLLSLAVNAFLVGAVATDLVRLRWGPPDQGERALRFELRWIEERLDAQSLREVEAAVGTARPQAVAHIEKLRELRNELARLIAANQPDRAAIDAQLAAIRTEVQAMQAEVQAATIDGLLALPPDRRAKLVEAAGTSQ